MSVPRAPLASEWQSAHLVPAASRAAVVNRTWPFWGSPGTPGTDAGSWSS
jgi:hypothetical protein